MLKFSGEIKNYDWGSKELYPLLSLEGNLPFAEYWLGRPELNFLLKFISAKKALSLQVHPNKKQAKIGFKKTQEAKPLGKIELYNDEQPKPEMVVSLGEFLIFSGFDEINEISKFIEQLESDTISKIKLLLSSYSDENSPKKLEGAFRIALTADPTEIIKLQTEIAIMQDKDEKVNLKRDMILAAIDDHPGDSTVFALLLLKAHKLEYGQALYTPENTIHSYVRGTGIEIMNNSDNTIRAGLTSKKVNLNEFIALTNFAEYTNAEIKIIDENGIKTYTPNPDFSVVFGKIKQTPAILKKKGTRILVALEDNLIAKTKVQEIILKPGESALVTEKDGAVEIEGEGKFVLAYNPSKQN